MRVGDMVRVVEGGGQDDFFDDGCVGILTEPSGETGWWVDFNNPKNARGTFCPDNGGVWAVSEHNLALVSDAPTNHEVAQLQARVAELEAALRKLLDNGTAYPSAFEADFDFDVDTWAQGACQLLGLGDHRNA